MEKTSLLLEEWILRDGISPEQLRKLYWDQKRSIPEIAKNLQVNPQTLYELMRQSEIPRRSLTDSNYLVNKHKPKFQLREKLTPELERLRIAGLMLYWAEGAKQRHTVDLANTDPDVILIFLRFLREVCGVAESRLRVFLYVYEGQDIAKIRRYWSRLTQIPETQFIKPYISKFRSDRSRQRVLPNGVVHIRYNDKKLIQYLLSSIKREANAFLSRADTQVANGV